MFLMWIETELSLFINSVKGDCLSLSLSILHEACFFLHYLYGKAHPDTLVATELRGEKTFIRTFLLLNLVKGVTVADADIFLSFY